MNSNERKNMDNHLEILILIFLHFPFPRRPDAIRFILRSTRSTSGYIIPSPIMVYDAWAIVLIIKLKMELNGV